ncbi:MAG: adenylyltransferase/cytidyltransferase family protein [Candidatus Moranbacteria bacterium]|nr:adenylyltransferase/cytidyltransferase family protein [Candidatus Moranbacteria bacterium]
MKTARNKIKSEKEIIEIAKKLKGAGKKIVTTNGSFDIFHFGHIKLFEEAKAQGDILIVGINSDKSVKEYKKKPGRPVSPENARAGVIAALEAVDFVFLFDDTTPNRWLEILKPDVHCNSSEYGNPEEWVEYASVTKNGGICHAVPRGDDGLSTTEIIDKIKKYC